MNDFYIEKVNKIRQNLASLDINPLFHLEQMTRSSDCVFSLSPVHPDFVEKIIGKLRNSKAAGLDEIDTFI